MDRKERAVYLTFDDGPTPGITEWILDQLAEYDAKATFFCLGKNAEQYAVWYLSLNGSRFTQAQNDFLRQVVMLKSTAEQTALVDAKLAEKRMQRLNALYATYISKGGVELK